MSDQAEREVLTGDGRERAKVNGKCPACGSGGLFVGSGGYLTCPWVDCPNPSAPHDALVKAPATVPAPRTVTTVEGPTGLSLTDEQRDAIASESVDHGQMLDAAFGCGVEAAATVLAPAIDPDDEALVEKVAWAIFGAGEGIGLNDFHMSDAWPLARAALKAVTS